MNFVHKYNYVQNVPEVDYGESQVDVSSYVDPKRRFAEMVAAGVRLEDQNIRRYFEYQGLVPPDAVPLPSMKQGLDLIDAARLVDQLNRKGQRLKQARDKYEKEAAEAADAKAKLDIEEAAVAKFKAAQAAKKDQSSLDD